EHRKKVDHKTAGRRQIDVTIAEFHYPVCSRTADARCAAQQTQANFTAEVLVHSRQAFASEGNAVAYFDVALVGPRLEGEHSSRRPQAAPAASHQGKWLDRPATD